MIRYALSFVYSLEAPPATVQFRFILTLYRTDALLALHAFLLAGITIYDIPVTLVYTHRVDPQHLVHLPFPFCI